MFSPFETESWKILFYLLIFPITVSIKGKQLPETKLLNNMLIFLKNPLLISQIHDPNQFLPKNSKHPEIPTLPTLI